MTRPRLTRLFAGTSIGALTLTGLTMLTPVAAEAATGPAPVCGSTTCVVTFGFTGAPETFTVPSYVSSVDVRVAGAQGGDADYQGAGGKGAVVSGVLAVNADEQFAVLVGQAGSMGGGAGFGGGAAPGTGGLAFAGSGGGGSFVFGAGGEPILVSGGGGGAVEYADGGAGSGHATSGGAGSIATLPSTFSSTAPTGGTQSGPGSGGVTLASGSIWGTPGTGGTGPALAGAPGGGGRGGDDGFLWNQGGGGGGGYYGGGGGGLYDTGAGGSGYAAPSLTSVSSTDGANGGNGWVSFTWVRPLPTVTLAVSPSTEATSSQAVALMATVTGAFGTPIGSLTFRDGGTAISGCTGVGLDPLGRAICFVTLVAGSHDLTAVFSGDPTYPSAQDVIAGYPVYAPLAVTTTSLPEGTLGESYSATLQGSGGKAPYTWTINAGSLPLGLTMSAAGVVSGTPTTASPTSVTVSVTDARGTSATSTISLSWIRRPATVALAVSPATDATSGEPVTLMATVTGDFAPPTGSVSLLDGSATIPGCAAVPLGIGGHATCVALLGAGSHDLTAVYGGDSTYPSGQDVVAGYQVYGPLAVTTTSLPAGTFGESYSATLLGAGGKAPYTWTITAGALPPGLTLSEAGVLSGTPTASSTGSVSVSVVDARSTSASKVLTISVAKATQAVTFTSTAPAAATVSGTYTPVALGGASSAPVTFSVAAGTTNAACSVADGVVSFDHAGLCEVAADQQGDDDHSAAPEALQQFEINRNVTSTSMTLAPNEVVSGQSARATAVVTGSTTGSVQFTVDGDPVGPAVPLSESGASVSGDLASTLAVGAHQVGATFTPGDANRFTSSMAVPQSITVDPAETSTTVSVTGSALTAAVAPAAPGAGVPTGQVDFFVGGSRVGSSALTEGVATLDYEVPTGSAQQVAAAYAGDGSFLGSSDSTARTDPTITATITSATPASRGWYRDAVTVTFRCETTTAPLSTSCPQPVTFSEEGAGLAVTRTVVATDGGAATVAVSGIRTDHTAPTVRVAGLRAGSTYFVKVPVAQCLPTDALSGVATCSVTRTRLGRRVVVTATATDLAGNRAVSRLVARTTRIAINGAAMKRGHYVVHRRHTYTVLVASSKRPRYTFAAPAPRRPAGIGPRFHHVGKNRWALGVTFTKSMRRHHLWNIGVTTGARTRVLTVRVVR